MGYVVFCEWGRGGRYAVSGIGVHGYIVSGVRVVGIV